MRYRVKKCKLEVLPLLDFLIINKEIEQLELLENSKEARLRVKEDIAKAALLRA